MSTRPDVIVIGSGISGGYAAKTLTEGGMHVLMIERGPQVDHGDYPTEGKEPWEMAERGLSSRVAREAEYGAGYSDEIDDYNAHFFATQASAPFETAPEKPFRWVRGHQLGGRSLTWGRGVPRWAAGDFRANATDGLGTSWPIGYEDVAPWYDRVEAFIGVSGADDGLAHWPSGTFQPPFALNAMEQHMREAIRAAFPGRALIAPRIANLTRPIDNRGACQARYQCSRGCSFGAYFSTQSTTLPAAEATGRLTLMTDSRVTHLLQSPTGRVIGVVGRNRRTGESFRIEATAVVLAASALSSVQILMNSRAPANPMGLGARSSALGRYIMDHPMCQVAVGEHDGLTENYIRGRRPMGTVMPRFQNIDGKTEDFARGYFYSVATWRAGWSAAMARPGFGAAFKKSLNRPGPWRAGFLAFAECLPYHHNHITLGDKLDEDGMPIVRIDMAYSANEHALIRHARREATAMLSVAGFRILSEDDVPGPPGMSIHEMGGARMGEDPRTSVTDRWSRLHDAPNVVVADGAVMASSACQNPSLTYMALAARACSRLAADIRDSVLA